MEEKIKQTDAKYLTDKNLPLQNIRSYIKVISKCFIFILSDNWIILIVPFPII